MAINQDADIDVKTNQKRFFIILSAAIVTLLLVLVVSISIFNKTGKNTSRAVARVTLCDLNSKELCIITFGVNNLDRMVINFQLPSKGYPSFYVKASNRGNVNVYSCDTVGAASTHTYCTGIRTPLGEPIDIEVYTTDGDVLTARGTFIVSAILISTPVNLATPESKTKTPTPQETSSAP